MKITVAMKDTLSRLGINTSGIEAVPNPAGYVAENEVQAVETNANEVMNTGAAGRGAELVPTVTLAKEIFDAIPTYPTFLNSLPGNHGVGLGKSEEVSIIGDPGFFKLHSEKTTGAFALAQGNSVLPTDKVTLNQKQYDLTIDVSNELKIFNVLGAAAFEAKLKEKITKAMIRTVEGLIINGDTTSGGTGNVNSDDGAPAADSYYLGANGIRQVGIAGTGTKVSVGTFDMADLIGVANCLGDYFADPSECLWLFNRTTYNTALNIAEFADASKNGKPSTINNGAIANILGADVFIARDLPKTEADGKVSTTPSNNTLGQFALVWKPAIQFGFGEELQLRLFDMGKDGFQLQGWFNVAVAIVQKDAGATDSSVGIGYNVTLL